MANLVNIVTIITQLHNLMGKRVSPNGTTDDLKKYCQSAFDYAWRYYKWRWAMKTGSTAADGILPNDFDLDGYYSVASTNNVIWDTDIKKLRFDPATAVTDFTYQIAPPTLGDDDAGSAPFPSNQVLALGASIYAKSAENPTRADVQQEWDMFHNELDRLVGRAYANTPRKPRNYLSEAGSFTGNVGA